MTTDARRAELEAAAADFLASSANASHDFRRKWLAELLVQVNSEAEARGIAKGRVEAFAQAIRLACKDGPLTVSELELLEEYGDDLGLSQSTTKGPER